MTQRIGKGPGDLLPLPVVRKQDELRRDPFKKQVDRVYSVSPRLPCI